MLVIKPYQKIFKVKCFFLVFNSLWSEQVKLIQIFLNVFSDFLQHKNGVYSITTKIVISTSGSISISFYVFLLESKWYQTKSVFSWFGQTTQKQVSGTQWRNVCMFVYSFVLVFFIIFINTTKKKSLYHCYSSL